MLGFLWGLATAAAFPPDAVVARFGGGPYWLPGQPVQLGFREDGAVLALTGDGVVAVDSGGGWSPVAEPGFLFDADGRPWSIGGAEAPRGPCTPPELDQLAVSGGRILRACGGGLWSDDRRLLRDIDVGTIVGADPLGQIAAIADPRRVRIVDPTKGKVLDEMELGAIPRWSSIRCRGDRCLGDTSRDAWVWEPDTGFLQVSVSGPSPVRFAALGPNGLLAAVATDRVVVSRDGQDPCVLPLSVPVDPSGAAAISPDGSRIVIWPGEQAQGLVVADLESCRITEPGTRPRFQAVAAVSSADRWALGTRTGLQWAEADGRLAGPTVAFRLGAMRLWSGPDAVSWSNVTRTQRGTPDEVWTLTPTASKSVNVPRSSSQWCEGQERVGWTCDVETPWAVSAGGNVGREELAAMETDAGRVLEVTVLMQAGAVGRAVWVVDVTRSAGGRLGRHYETWVQQAGELHPIRNVPRFPRVALSRDGAVFVAAGAAGIGFYDPQGDGPIATFPAIPGDPVEVEIDPAGRWVVVASSGAVAIHERTPDGVEQRTVVELGPPAPVDTAILGDRLAVISEDGSVTIVDLARLVASAGVSAGP